MAALGQQSARPFASRQAPRDPRRCDAAGAAIELNPDDVLPVDFETGWLTGALAVEPCLIFRSAGEVRLRPLAPDQLAVLADVERFADIGRWDRWLILRFSPHDARLQRTASDIGKSDDCAPATRRISALQMAPDSRSGSRRPEWTGRCPKALHGRLCGQKRGARHHGRESRTAIGPGAAGVIRFGWMANDSGAFCGHADANKIRVSKSIA